MTIELSFKGIKTFLNRQRAFFGIIAAIVIYWFSGDLLAWLDPAAATYERGHVQRWLYLGATALVLNSLSNLIMKALMPKWYHYVRNGEGADDFTEIDKTQALWMYTATYCAIIVALAIAFLAL
jgi:hypothetical protein